MSTTRPFFALLGVVLALFAVALAFGTIIPSPRLYQTVSIDPANLTFLSDGTARAQRYPQDLAVLLDVPVQVVLGKNESAAVEVRPLAVESSVAGGPQDATTTYHPVAVATLSSSLGPVRPDGEEGQSLVGGKPVRFTWSLGATEAKTGDMTLVVRLRFYPNAGGDPVERVILARTLAVTAVSVMGMSASVARVVAAGGFAAGAVLMAVFGTQAVEWLRRS